MLEANPKTNIRIATVYSQKSIRRLYKMSTIRWFRMSEALANKGYSVDMIVNNSGKIKHLSPTLRLMPYDKVRWAHYDIIKTLFHEGFECLMKEGVSNHRFIISKLGSVVSHKEHSGVHFHGRARKKLYDIQTEISYKSKYVSLLTEASRDLWMEEFGRRDNVLLVPTGVDADIPLPSNNPYRKFKEKIAVFIGNIYSSKKQRDVNLRWQRRLNMIGKLLKKKGIRLCLVVFGSADRLDASSVTYIGPIDNKFMWDYQYFADAGLVLAQGAEQHNESSKIYYYLRTGLPVISDNSIPNNNLISKTGLGFIAGYGNDKEFADLVDKAVCIDWGQKRNEAIRYILNNHTWEKRVEIYDKLINHVAY